MEKILVPIDFSGESKKALGIAVNIALQSQAKIDLLNIIEHTGGSKFSVSGEFPTDHINLDDIYVAKLMKKNKRALHKLATKGANKSAVSNFMIEVNPIDPLHKIIVDKVKEEDYDLVVMGTKGSVGINDLLFGSNTEKVVRYAPCPVIAIKENSTIGRIKNITFPCDFSEELDDEVIYRMKDFAEMYGARINLLYIDAGDFESSRRDKMDKMSDFVEKYVINDYTLNIVEKASIESGIEEFSDKLEGNIIAIATHGKSGFVQIFNGSIAESLVNHSNHVVMTFNINTMSQAKVA